MLEDPRNIRRIFPLNSSSESPHPPASLSMASPSFSDLQDDSFDSCVQRFLQRNEQYDCDDTTLPVVLEPLEPLGPEDPIPEQPPVRAPVPIRTEEMKAPVNEKKAPVVAAPVPTEEKKAPTKKRKPEETPPRK